MPRTVAVTGGTGFVGANLVRRLLADGHEVHLLNRPGFAQWRIHDVLADVRVHEGDLAADGVATRLLGEIKPEWVFHLAAYGAYSWQTDPLAIVRTNYLAFVQLVLAAQRADVGVFINTGSSSEYGLKGRAAHESDALHPNSDYAATKSAATLYAQFAARKTQRPIPTLRLYSVYGPWEEPNRLLPKLVYLGMRGALPPLTSPATARDFVWIGDVVDAYIAAATRPHEDPGAIYNVCSGVQTRLADVVETARRVLGILAEPAWGTMEDRDWDTSVWCGEPAAAAQALGWRARTTLEAGLASLAHWFTHCGSAAAHYADAYVPR